MRRIWIFLLLTLLLAGCSQKPKDPSPGTTPTVTQTQPTGPGLYAPDSLIEEKTGGAVKCYPLEEDTYTDLICLGKELLLQSRDHTRLTLLAGENLVPVVEKEVNFHMGAIQTGDRGITYLDEKSGAVIFLNHSLHQISSMKIPEDRLGPVWLSPEWDTLYYCTVSGIRALNMNTGISRLLLEQSSQSQKLTGSLYNGRVLQCQINGEDSAALTQLVDTQKGTILWQGDTMTQLAANGKHWFACVDRGTVQELLFGQDDGIRNLWLEDAVSGILPLPERNAVVTYREDQQGCLVDYYDLTAGNRRASVCLAGVQTLLDMDAAADGETIWLLVRNGNGGTDMICRWDLSASTETDQKIYTDAHYTREEPDVAGLQALQTQLQAVEQAYGIQIRIADGASDGLPEGCWVETEYLVPAFEAYLPVLQKAMDAFPEGFFQLAAQHTSDRKLHIGLVRTLRGEVSQMPVIQWWQDGTAHLILAMDEDLEQSFYHGISHLIETRILSTCTAYYSWDQLNPVGFAYDNDYIKNLDRKGTQYLKGEARAFVDTFSMSFAREDRARIMEYACMPGNEALFHAPVMQQKLQKLCAGIREAFGLEAETYLWEQYLQKE